MNKDDKTITAYPLAWPEGWPRTAHPEEAKFSAGRGGNKWQGGRYRRGCSMTAARQALQLQIDFLLGSRRSDHWAPFIVSSNIPVRRDGFPYANAREPEDSGVAVYFKLDGQDKCFPADKYDRVADNIHAVAKTIEALRGIERWGARHMMDAAFRGFRALPPGQPENEWWSVLGLSEPVSDRSLIKRAFAKQARGVHSDTGGEDDPVGLARLIRAKETGLSVATR